MRVCQPLPIALKASNTSASKRMVVEVFRGFFCGPLGFGFRNSPATSGARISGRTSEAGLARAKSSFVSSLTSPSSLVNGNRFPISTGLSFVGFTKTDNPNSTFYGREAQNMQPCIQISNSHEAGFRVINPVIRNDDGVRPFEIGSTFKRQLPFGLILGTLFGVEFNSQKTNCSNNKANRQHLNRHGLTVNALTKRWSRMARLARGP
jgi:hypothetical protein